jgi:hypothetical protein
VQNGKGYQRLAGSAGLIGALLFFCGDMLFYGHWGAGASFREGMQTVLRQGSLTRLFTGGLIGPVAACLCIIGFWHVRQNIEPRSPVLGRVVFYALAAMMVIGGAVHAVWVPRGLAIKYSGALGAYAPDLISALRNYWQYAYNLAAVPGYFGAVLLFALVLLGKSLYPRWTAVTNFGVLSLLAPLASSGTTRLSSCGRLHQSFDRRLFPCLPSSRPGKTQQPDQTMQLVSSLTGC